jgi:hypothetical protein
MYRSSMVTKGEPFYDETRLHEDTEKCMEILEHWDFGFVHQVLSYCRADNESISSVVRGFQPNAIDRYIIVKRYASVFLDASEAAALKRKTKRQYYGVLAEAVLRGRESAFWQYHARGLKTLGETLDQPYLALAIARDFVWKVANPGATLVRGLRYLKQKARRKRSPIAD